MATLHGRYPEDADVAALYGLSLLATMSRGLTGSEDVHEGHGKIPPEATQTGSPRSSRRVSISSGTSRRLNHLLHAYDDRRARAR